MSASNPVQWNIEPRREPIEIGGFVMGEWEVLRLIGEGSYGHVYEIAKNAYGIEKRSALKVISIPKSSEERKTLAAEMDEESVTQYLASVVDSAVGELNALMQMSDHPNVMRCEDFGVVQYEEDNSWDIFMRLELLESLPEYLQRKGLPEPAEAARLGEEICRALSSCEKRHIIHRDVKPENIFIGEAGNFKLGDFGLARIVSESSMASSMKGTELYMAPEVLRGEPYGKTVDTYALGLVLYRLLNDNLLPFYAKGKVTVGSREQAFLNRMKGEAMPAPTHADPELAAIVLKACAFRPENRFQTAEEMRRALADFRAGAGKEERYRELSRRSLAATEPEELSALASEWEALNWRDSGKMAETCRQRAESRLAALRAEADRKAREAERARKEAERKAAEEAENKRREAEEERKKQKTASRKRSWILVLVLILALAGAFLAGNEKMGWVKMPWHPTPAPVTTPPPETSTPPPDSSTNPPSPSPTPTKAPETTTPSPVSLEPPTGGVDMGVFD